VSRTFVESCGGGGGEAAAFSFSQVPAVAAAEVTLSEEAAVVLDTPDVLGASVAAASVVTDGSPDSAEFAESAGSSISVEPQAVRVINAANTAQIISFLN
jgi:hypothetical protein